MFNLFRSKSKKEQLEEEYQRLMDKSYKVQESNEEKADQFRMKAQHIMQEIVLLERETRVSLN